jgi:adenine-specific DNA-methyltransferase
MANVLDSLLARVDDEALRDAILAEVASLRSSKEFGLVFERHLPETVALFTHPVRRGTRVRFRADDGGELMPVLKVVGAKATIMNTAGLIQVVPAADLVVVSSFGETIYPGFRPVERLERGGSRPFHTVINGENHHVLEALSFAYEGRVDCIYIDPPYNTGARDWKYNNAFVDGKDAYRHSKWLSFMERRLTLCRRLLKDDGVLIVTIDENEQHHLMTLMEQIFPGHALTPIVVQHNPRGIQGDNFSMTHETAIFATPRGRSVTSPQPITDDSDAATLRNWGGESDRGDAKNCFYPIFVRDGKVIGFGDVLPEDQHPGAANEEQPDGSIAVWPIDQTGAEKKWRYARQTVESIKHLLYPKLIKQGRRKGVLDVQKANDSRPFRSVWVAPRYDASTYGTKIVTALAGSAFPFPKSLYSVYDCLYAATAHKPDAVILDFFAGSGTTPHATCLLNALDGGRRTSIAVTNNEVGVEAASKMAKEGVLPGTEEWEKHGIYRSITHPRVANAVRGTVPDSLAESRYLGGDERAFATGFDENVAFVELVYLDRNGVSRGDAFEAIAPLLWLRAGGRGEMVGSVARPFSVPSGAAYGVLFDIHAWQPFVEAVEARPDLVHAFIVTDSLAQYQQVVAELPPSLEASMLYEDYLRNFEIVLGGAR